MRVVTELRRHLNSALTHGRGYESTPRGSYVSPTDVAGYYIDFTAKTTSPSASDPTSLLPAALAQLALGWWERMLAGDEHAEPRFREVVELVERRAVEDGEALVWHYDGLDRKYHTSPPRISCLSQAQAASVFVRRFALDGDERYASLARRAAMPLLRRDEPSVLVALPAGPALEEAPSEPASLILNGWIYALWGLRDLAVGLDDVRAAQIMEESESCLAALVPRYDVGWWSRYSLYPHRLPDLAKVFYHRLHVDQLTVMHELTGTAIFRETADRWRGYDTPARRARLVLQKARFVASGYR